MKEMDYIMEMKSILNIVDEIIKYCGFILNHNLNSYCLRSTIIYVDLHHTSLRK